MHLRNFALPLKWQAGEVKKNKNNNLVEIIFYTKMQKKVM